MNTRALIYAAIALATVTPTMLLSGYGGVAQNVRARVPEDRVYTLYRGTPFGDPMRIHIATFDADEPERYNKGNAEIARDLFQNQPGVVAKYWIEKGYYRP